MSANLSQNKRYLNQAPIFVVGCPRSGTTLLQALLAAQGDLVTFPETHFFSAMFSVCREFRETIGPAVADEVIEKIEQWGGIVFEESLVRDLLTGEGVSVKAMFETLVLKLFPDGADAGMRWLEKTPIHGLYMEQILRFYPEAMFVGIVRDPFYVIKSRTQYFPPQVKDVIKRLAAEWVMHMRAIDEFLSNHSDKALLVRYEDLVNDPPAILAPVCNFLGISFDLDRIKDFSQIAEKIIQPFEYWKGGVKNGGIVALGESAEPIFGLRESLKILMVVHTEMRKHGYRPQHPLLRRIYNLFG